MSFKNLVELMTINAQTIFIDPEIITHISECGGDWTGKALIHTNDNCIHCLSMSPSEAYREIDRQLVWKKD